MTKGVVFHGKSKRAGDGGSPVQVAAGEHHFQVAVRTGKAALVETDGFPPLWERICEAESFKYVVTRWLETSGARPYYRTAPFSLQEIVFL